MIRNRTLLTLGLAVICIPGIIVCSNTASSPKENAATETSPPQEGAPVETNPPNSNYKPAFAGQTRIAGVKTKAAYEGRILTKDLKSPWGITSLPDGRFLITE